MRVSHRDPRAQQVHPDRAWIEAESLGLTIAWKWERPIAIVRAPSSAMERGGGSSAFRSA